jgi:superfamily I DNA and/or RNA helicase
LSDRFFAEWNFSETFESKSCFQAGKKGPPSGTHSHPEQTAAAGLSKVNMQEIAMVHLAVSHLLTQGVSPSSITVITPYLGQRRAIQGSFMGAAIRGAKGEGYNTGGGGLPPPSPGVLNSMSAVRVSTVDMFQGDENDIIILSLVRTERLTDFMKMRNRMIVACSRARFAMVVVGCEGLLRQAEHWSQVVDILSDDNLAGEGLPITTTTTTTSADRGSQPNMCLYHVGSTFAFHPTSLVLNNSHHHSSRPLKEINDEQFDE